MDVIQAIKERRSIRKYRAELVSDEELNTILEAARWAPSWGNTQTWRIIVVKDQDMKAKLSETLLSSRGPGTRNAAADSVANAPVVLVACAQRGQSGFYRAGEKQGQPATDKGEWWFMFDLGLAMQNVTLAAHSLGLGTVHVGLFDNKAVGRLLGVPENIAVVEMMPLGRPDEKPAARPRKEIGELVFRERYGG